MNILFVVPYVPNPIRVRPYSFIKYLVAKGHKVSLLTLWSDQQDLSDIEALKANCEAVQTFYLPRWQSLLNCLGALPTSIPLQARYCWSRQAAAKLVDWASSQAGARFDVVHIEHLRGVNYGLFLKRAGFSDAPLVWDSVDSISYLFRQAAVKSKGRFSRWLTRFELSRTEVYEGWLLKQFKKILVTSQVDRQAFLSLASAEGVSPERVAVLPNGVDLDFFKPATDLIREPATLVISGKMSYHANVTMTLHLTKEIMPRLWEKRPEIQLWIVGKDPPTMITSLAADPRIKVTGTVKDIRPYLQRATIAVAPIAYGAGIQNKVLEAMACGTPVVCTPQAVSALAIKPDEEVLVEQDSDNFARKVLFLLDNEKERQRIGQAARSYVERNHDWCHIVDCLVDHYFGAREN